MTYDSIHAALVSVIKRATGRPAISYENDKDDQKQGHFKGDGKIKASHQVRRDGVIAVRL